ncbi:OLC1v1036292C1 [Oldenlandia corymbosa var. corymbosa]|uniref:OLC1v1036292C1 n=1 Tax=Oldenlandia corymbosa var. corymbosa TaxID=529605 RepID=A0AAV1CWX2_OLDCO|nr:OLC1v1036292C1 [Oldenlandia corymbosa var. corymbosa]
MTQCKNKQTTHSNSRILTNPKLELLQLQWRSSSAAVFFGGNTNLCIILRGRAASFSYLPYLNGGNSGDAKPLRDGLDVNIDLDSDVKAGDWGRRDGEVELDCYLPVAHWISGFRLLKGGKLSLGEVWEC